LPASIVAVIAAAIAIAFDVTAAIDALSRFPARR
jgi:hypothetical protein